MEKKNYREIDITGSYIPYEVEVVAGKDINIKNFRQPKLGNLYSIGATIKVKFKDRTATYQLKDQDLVHDFRLARLEYIVLGRTWSNGKHEYPNGRGQIHGYYKRFMDENFEDKKAAVAYLKSPEFKAMKAALPNTFDLLRDAMLEDLADTFNQWLQQAVLRTSLLKLPSIKTQMYKLGLKVDTDAPLRNEVTPVYTNVPYRFVRKSDDGLRVSVAKKEELIYSDLFEAHLVDAWLEQRPEFRVPTLDEQMQELLTLRDWFAEYKAAARANNMAWISQEDIIKFERLEELEFEVGPYVDALNPDWIAE